ncbi:MAG TPA: hypothetical protein VFK57_22555 [Vicinamibacterales bacterium]|nr:hypothetical protein [Vicinamibacterales bacterium]
MQRMKLVGIAVVAALALPVALAAAQEKPGTAKPPAETAAPARAVPTEGLPVNVRLEITITDQRGNAEPIVKTVTKTVADRSWIRIRTGADVQTRMGMRPVVLNIDSYPRVIPTPGTQNPSNKLKVDLTIDYRPVAAEADSEKSTTPSINESLTIILEDGKSMVISQSADPATDRKVRVEAKATILK